MRPWIVALVAVLAGIAIALLLITERYSIAEELRLPLLAVISVVTVMAALAFVSTIFAHAGLDTKEHALALPEGSVRALIALSLIVVFTVITLFVLVRFSKVDSTCAECRQTIEEVLNRKPNEPAPVTDTTATTDTATTVSAAPAGPAATTGAPAATGAPGTTGAPASTGTTTRTASTAPATPDPIATAVAKRIEAGYDLAKQLLTMLGTLLAAISSFYFGASSTAAATTTDPEKLKKMAEAVKEIKQS